MGCLNCNSELNHTQGKRKKQFCSPDCRVRYWQKNKPKKESAPTPPAIHYHVHDITCSANPEKPMGSEGCSCEMYRRAKKAEEELSKLTSHLNSADPTALIDAYSGQNKPNTAPETEKPPKFTQKEKKGKEGAGNGYYGSKEHFNDIANGRDEEPPKTLEDVKALCPTHLKGLDRSIWIAQERKKYGI